VAERDLVYLAWVASRPCLLASWGGCLGAVHAHHPREQGSAARKAPDSEAIPLCAAHHLYDLHQLAKRINGHHGFFARLTREARREWERGQAIRMRALYADQLARDAETVPF